LNADSGYAEVNDTRLYYEVTGKGEALILIHGFTLDTRLWDYQFQEFSKHYKVIRYDIRGYGKSSNPSEGKQYANYEDLKQLLDYLNIETAHVLGLSLGGSIAINFTLEYPQMVSSLILVGTILDGFSKNAWRGFNPLFKTAREQGVEKAMEEFLGYQLWAPTLGNPVSSDRIREIVSRYGGVVIAS
jgi:pimeloyl-ACP methyl ester carboxylesterase